MFNLATTPFSAYGSYFAVSQIDGDYYLKDLHGGDESPPQVFKLSFSVNETATQPQVSFSETELKFTSGDKYVSIRFIDEATIHIFASGLKIAMQCIKSRYDSLIELREKTYHMDFYSKEIKYLIKTDGDTKIAAPWHYVGNSSIEISAENGSVIIHEFKTVTNLDNDFETADAGIEQVKKHFKTFSDKLHSGANQNDSMTLAAYIIWSSFVHPEGCLTDYALYMSKNFMNNIWSWDNAFNAISLSKDFPELSLKQFELFFGFQDECGVYPDYINDKFVSYSCTKPPVHSWAFSKMRSNNQYFQRREVTLKVYESLKKQGEFWINHRCLGALKAPTYFHGNDSGWDNSSIFHKSLPVQSPDLLAHLIRHFDIMSQLADELGLTNDCKNNKAQADALFDMLCANFQDDSGFFARDISGNIIENRDSLLLMIPIILSYRLDKSVVERMVNRLESSFLTEFGLSTESLASKLYKSDGYWLGPIWGAPTLLIYDALNNGEHSQFAAELKQRFEKLVARGGMAENFNAITGDALSDPAFTWTAGVYLSMMKGLV